MGAGAFFLLFLIIVVAAGVGLFFYLGGAAMWKKETDPEAGEEQSRPNHVETGQPTEGRIFPSSDGAGERDKSRIRFAWAD
jgi:hypothetical protein